MYAYKYDSDFYYAGQQDCQLDPIATKREVHEVWLLPANCTWEEPLEEKEGYKIKWNGEAWEYEEIPVPPEPEPPTLEEVKAAKKAALTAEYNADVASLKEALTTAALNGDSELETEIKAEYADLQASYKEELEALE